MDWGTLVATATGAVIAIAGTVLADRLRVRHDDDRGHLLRRRDAYIAFIVAVGVCHTQLRQIAQGNAGSGDPDAASRAVLADAGIYDVRERLFIDATAPVAAAGQAMFERLRALRQVVATGAGLSSATFHDAYHPYLDAVWRYRAAVRAELETTALSPTIFGWDSWDGNDRCQLCRPAASGA
ncbi:CchlQ [Frankia sp. AgB1.9]|uniref:CchlQ n=1 Tax=unclassified Frankia TaxID=2632575 RepID=UPI0019343F04|nr:MULTISPECIES: CchlQ [unclassified Frankia]MBL7489961.1 CchlQ [Frankia sp. AgW1.1]MBL7552151.1 CchlQ [Frankia sp. AgB1.9]MBL7625252.1 CchlQ [Frankia sp. AgB1.8]